MFNSLKFKVILFGFIFTFFSSFGQSYFLGLFNSSIREALSITHGQFGSIYASATLCSSLLLIWVGKKIDDVNIFKFAFFVIILLSFACFFFSRVTSIFLLFIAIFLMRFSGQGMMSHTASTTISRYFTPSGRCIQALDYTKKDVNGKAIKIKQENFNEFKTKGGRSVYDGGGILPDVIIEETKLSAITDDLVKNDAIFDFATQLYYNYQNTGLPNNISEADFNAFKLFLKQEKYNFATETSLALKKVLETAKKEKIETGITKEYALLQAAIEKSMNEEVIANKKEILKLLYDELIIRFQYREGLYLNYTQNNTEINKAKSILNNETEYKKILKK